MLEREGLVFSRSLPTHDQLDGALCAWLGLLWLSKSDRLRHVGEAPRRLGGWLREGRIVDFRAESVGDSTRRAGRPGKKAIPHRGSAKPLAELAPLEGLPNDEVSGDPPDFETEQVARAMRRRAEQRGGAVEVPSGGPPKPPWLSGSRPEVR